MSALPTLSIIGSGRVGKAIGRLLHATGSVCISEVLVRKPALADAALAFIGAGSAVNIIGAMQPATIFLLTVPDDRIEACCNQLTAAGCVRPGSIVFHCSGAQTSALLASASAAGAVVASVHPVRSFADPALVAASFAGTCCGVEGDAAALAVLTPLFEASGARMVAIDPTQKTLYHAAAVFASNYLVTLVDVAMQCYGQAGVAPETALQMIAPLLRESAENALRLGPGAALTGPVARGDMATVVRQQQALLQWLPAHAALYAQLAGATAALAASRDTSGT